MIYHENCLPADNSHEISCLICYFGKSSEILNCRLLQIIGGALRVKVFSISDKSMFADNLRGFFNGTKIYICDFLKKEIQLQMNLPDNSL